mmetsp:Transcript_11974/g.24131  ORF Transcript_11974/g.24131 Transcript_11974/m.24131 type:complete len:105 (-) Transcript_11974:617-931(-)
MNHHLNLTQILQYIFLVEKERKDTSIPSPYSYIYIDIKMFAYTEAMKALQGNSSGAKLVTRTTFPAPGELKTTYKELSKPLLVKTSNFCLKLLGPFKSSTWALS